MRAKMNQKMQARGKRTRNNLEALRDDLVKHAAMVTRERKRETERGGERKGDREMGAGIWRGEGLTKEKIESEMKCERRKR